VHLVSAPRLANGVRGRPSPLAGRQGAHPGCQALVAPGVSLYGAVLFNAFELGENMRFRAAVAPVNIALTFGLLAALLQAGRDGAPASTARGA
jgi:hypothetical protein